MFHPTSGVSSFSLVSRGACCYSWVGLLSLGRRFCRVGVIDEMLCRISCIHRTAVDIQWTVTDLMAIGVG